MNSPRSSSTNPPRRRSRADRNREGRIKRKRHARPTPGATTLICTVCGDAALGCAFIFHIDLGKTIGSLKIFIVRFSYNFDALCCESCKAFFRRNGERLQVYLLFSYAFSFTNTVAEIVSCLRNYEKV